MMDRPQITDSINIRGIKFIPLSEKYAREDGILLVAFIPIGTRSFRTCHIIHMKDTDTCIYCKYDVNESSILWQTNEYLNTSNELKESEYIVAHIDIDSTIEIEFCQPRLQKIRPVNRIS